MFNKVVLAGRLGADPELKLSQNGNPYCTLSLATTEVWYREGEKQEQTEWHRVVVFGSQADAVGKYMRKGSAVLVEGKIGYSKYTDKEGIARTSTQIKAGRVVFLGKSGGDAPKRTYAPRGASPAQPTAPAAPVDEFNDDDIPF